MCKICDDWESKKISPKEAYRRIGDALRDQSDPEKTGHLMELSAIILDKDVPMTESNADLDKDWWDENHEE